MMIITQLRVVSFLYPHRSSSFFGSSVLKRVDVHNSLVVFGGQVSKRGYLVSKSYIFVKDENRFFNRKKYNYYMEEYTKMTNMKSLNLFDLEGITGGTITEEQMNRFILIAEINSKIAFDTLCMLTGITEPEDVAYAKKIFDQIRSRNAD